MLLGWEHTVTIEKPRSEVKDDRIQEKRLLFRVGQKALGTVLIAFIRRSFYLWIYYRVLEEIMGVGQGYVYLDRGNFSSALESFNAFIKLDPRRPKAALVKIIIKTMEKAKE